MQEIQQQIGYQFKNKDLLRIALTHRSAGSENNERLEFLGDSLLNFFVAEKLFQVYPDANEGELSRLRASLVKGDTLADLANELTINQYLQLGAGEIKSGGANRRSILATTMEAIIGAIYLDSDMTVCRERVIHWLSARFALIVNKGMQKDPKTTLQEYLQAKKLPLPKYSILEIAGKAHTQLFHVECKVTGLKLTAQGVGTSRRKAEQDAAQKLLEKL